MEPADHRRLRGRVGAGARRPETRPRRSHHHTPGARCDEVRPRGAGDGDAAVERGGDGALPRCRVAGVERTISNKTVTYDFERLMEGAKLLKCSEFAKAIVANM